MRSQAPLRPNAALIPGWANMSATVRVLVAGSVPLGLLTLGAVFAEMAAHGDVAMWAASAGWTLGGLTALSGTLAAALSATRFSASWRLYAAAAGCWLAGAILLDIQADGDLNGVAGIFWLAFPVLGVASMLRRLPRAAVYGIFLLDAIPVILLVLATIRSGFFIPAPGGQTGDLLTELYPALYLVLAANAIQLAGLYESLRDIRPWVRVFTVAFCLMALAALVGGHPSVGSRPGIAHWAAPLWTLGLFGLGASGVVRASHPDAATSLPLTDKHGGPHALPPAAAVLGLIMLLAVVPGRQRALVQAFLLARRHHPVPPRLPGSPAGRPPRSGGCPFPRASRESGCPGTGQRGASPSARQRHVADQGPDPRRTAAGDQRRRTAGGGGALRGVRAEDRSWKRLRAPGHVGYGRPDPGAVRRAPAR
jgi:hypothetical protein